MKSISPLFTVFLVFTLLIVSFLIGSFAIANESAGQKLYQPCSNCHTEANKKLFGKDETYLLNKINGFAEGSFSAGSGKKMQDLLSPLSTEQRSELAKYISTK